MKGSTAYFFLCALRYPQQTRDHSELWFREVRGELRLAQGRLEEAVAEIDQARKVESAHRGEGIHERWYHDFLPLIGEVAAARGRLDEVREVAQQYLDTEVHESEEVMKVGVLRPLVRAEVDAALTSQGDAGADHVRRARETIERMRELIGGASPITPQLESPSGHLAMAEGEISRVMGADPELWAKAHEGAFTAYWRLYARWGQAEALVETGDEQEASEELKSAYIEAIELDSKAIRGELEALAERLGVELAEHPRAEASAERRDLS